MSDPIRYEPGQRLWFVPSYGMPREVTIVRVGRKWAAFPPYYRVDIRTGHVEENGGKLYASQEAHAATVVREKLIGKLSAALDYRNRREIAASETEIREAARLLGVNVDG